MAEGKRDWVLTVFAVLFGLLAVSDLLKPLGIGAETGFVFFGTRLSGFWNAVVGPLFGIYLALYAWAIWSMRRFAIAMAHAYAAYVVLNLILFAMNNPTLSRGLGYAVFTVVYAAVAIGVALGAAIVLTTRKEELA